MAENENEKEQVLSGGEAEAVTPDEKRAKSGKKKGKSFKENIIRDGETAKERGRNGGVKSGEVRRAKRDARESIQYLLGRMTKNKKIRENLKELGVEDTELSNMIALQGRLFTMAMSGDLDAYLTLMKMGGYEPEETRKERESLSADYRKNRESEARIEGLAKGNIERVSSSFTDADENGEVEDVFIYLPDNGRDREMQNIQEPKEEETDGTDDTEAEE